MSRRKILESVGAGAAAMIAGGSTTRLLAASARPGNVFRQYLATWNRLRDGHLVQPTDMIPLLADKTQLDQRMERWGHSKAWGVFSSCEPHPEVYYDYLVGQFAWMLDTKSKALPAPYDRGQLFAWNWSYVGRAAVALWSFTGDDRFRTIFVKAARIVMSWRDDRHNRIDTIQKRSVASWGAYFVIDGRSERVTDITTTGLIALPFLRFSAALRPGDPNHDEFTYYVDILGKSVWEFDSYYIPLADKGAGYYHNMLQPDLAEPINHMNAIGAALIELHNLTGQQRFLDRAMALMTYFRLAITHRENGMAWWPYIHPPDGSSQPFGEAFWKTGVTMELPLACWRLRQLVEENEMSALARTYAEGFFASDSVVHMQIGDEGTGDQINLATDYTRLSVEIRGLVPTILAGNLLSEFDSTIPDTLTQYIVNYPQWFDNGTFCPAPIAVMVAASRHGKR